MTLAQQAGKDKAPDAVPEGHVRLTIDGREVDAPKGELVIRTCERLGIIVPRFCDHPLLDPAGACRQCIVEVEGQRTPMASCTHCGARATRSCTASHPSPASACSERRLRTVSALAAISGRRASRASTSSLFRQALSGRGCGRARQLQGSPKASASA